MFFVYFDKKKIKHNFLLHKYFCIIAANFNQNVKQNRREAFYYRSNKLEETFLYSFWRNIFLFVLFQMIWQINNRC